MGVSSEDLSKGILDFGKVIVDGMKTWESISKGGSPPLAQTTTPSQPAVANQQQVAVQPMGGLDLNAVPPWAWLLGGVGVFLLWRRR